MPVMAVEDKVIYGGSCGLTLKLFLLWLNFVTRSEVAVEILDRSCISLLL